MTYRRASTSKIYYF